MASMAAGGKFNNTGKREKPKRERCRLCQRKGHNAAQCRSTRLDGKRAEAIKDVFDFGK